MILSFARVQWVKPGSVLQTLTVQLTNITCNYLSNIGHAIVTEMLTR